MADAGVGADTSAYFHHGTTYQPVYLNAVELSRMDESDDNGYCILSCLLNSGKSVGYGRYMNNKVILLIISGRSSSDKRVSWQRWDSNPRPFGPVP